MALIPFGVVSPLNQPNFDNLDRGTSDAKLCIELGEIMKKHIIALGFALIFTACGEPASRDNANAGNWLYTDRLALQCQQELRIRNVIPNGMPVQFYPDTANIVQIRANNPGIYVLTESEFKNLCRTIGLDLDANIDSGSGRR